MLPVDLSRSCCCCLCGGPRRSSAEKPDGGTLIIRPPAASPGAYSRVACVGVLSPWTRLSGSGRRLALADGCAGRRPVVRSFVLLVAPLWGGGEWKGV
jgi:hypothetical protein